MSDGGDAGRARDRLKQLRAFCHAARLESMSKAADHLSLTQPAVSQQVRALEREFSATFFERRGPRIALTPAGESLYHIAMPLVRGVDRLPDTLAEALGDETSGEVRVVAGMTASTFLLPRYLKDFRASWPSVRLSLRTAALAEGLRLVYDREADFSLGAVEMLPEGLEFHPFRESRYVLITHPDHPLTRMGEASPHAIAVWPFVLPARGTVARAAADLVARHFGAELKVVVETGGWSVIKSFVEQDVGIAFVPDICIGERDLVRVVPIEERLARQMRTVNYGAVVYRPEFLPLAARRFIRMMVPDFPDAAL